MTPLDQMLERGRLLMHHDLKADRIFILYGLKSK